MNRFLRRIRRAYSLVEVIMATLVVGIIMAGALAVMGQSIRSQVVAADQDVGAELAEQLLAEIMSQPYLDPVDGGSNLGTDAGEGTTTRADFDDVDDYELWSEADAEDRTGTAYPEYAGWSRSVRVYWANLSTGKAWSQDSGVKRIEVSVTAPDGTATLRTAFSSTWGTLQQAPDVDTTVVTSLNVKLKTQSGTAQSYAAANLFNHVADPNTN